MEKDKQSEQSGAQRILGQGHMSWKDGGFFLWNVPGIIFPLYSFVDLTYSLRQACGDEFNSLSYEVGERQTIIGVDYMKQRFGFKREIDLVNSILQQSAILGYGLFSVVKLDAKNCSATFKNQNNAFAKCYKQMYGPMQEAIDYYFSGTMAGVMEAMTGKTLAAVETECIAKGDPHCIFEVRLPEKIAPEYKHQLPKVLLGPAKIRELVGKEKEIVSTPKL